MKKKEYDLFRKNQANLHGLLRAAVSLYLLWLAYQLAFTGGEDTSFPPAARIAVGVLFAVCAAAFGVYTFKRYQTECKKAELTDEEIQAAERDEDDER